MPAITEYRACTRCSAPFRVSEGDRSFYRRIEVPEPTFCPLCRRQRRMAFRNERVIYRRPCAACGNQFISIYRPESPYRVLCHHCYFKDDWDQFASGLAYDPGKPFFAQYAELALRAPKCGVQRSADVFNSDYTNHIANCRDCYLIFASTDDERCLYGNYVNGSLDTADVLGVRRCELSYECVDCSDCYNLKFSQNCAHCADSAFLYNCRSAADCYMCANLRRGSYLINNQQHSKDDYTAFITGLRLGRSSALAAEQKKYAAMLAKTLRQAMSGLNNEEVSGDDVRNCRNCGEVFDLSDSEDSKFCMYGSKTKCSYDLYGCYPSTELCYECVGSGSDSYQAKFCYLPWRSSLVEYCINAFSCRDCFGCNQIHNAQYCILNRRYSQAEYTRLRSRIITDMRRRGDYGEFFPVCLSPFAYNETIAQLYFPLDEKAALPAGFTWRNKDERDYLPSQIDIPDDIRGVPDDFTTKTLSCRRCSKNYRVVTEELKFYRRLDLPIPAVCPDCRHAARLNMRNPRRLWQRTCGCCGKTIESTYAPERPEMVYCTECFLQAI